MATKVHMQAMSPTMEEGQVVRWLKQEGDAVSEGDVLAEIETDKATMELVSRGSGVLRKRFLKEGDTAPVGAVIAIVAGPDEDISGLLQEAPDEAEGGAEGAGEQTQESLAQVGSMAAEELPDRPPLAVPPGIDETRAAGGRVERPAAPTEEDGRVKASPLARRLAAEAGLELSSVKGTGPGGRVIRRDIEAALAAAERAPAPEAPKPAAPAYAPPAAVAEVEEVPVSQMRKTIAKRLVTSIGPVPTFYLTIEVD